MTTDSNSTISPSGSGIISIPEGSYQTFVFSARPGYSISSVTVNGEPLPKSIRDEGRITLCGGYSAVNSTIVVKSIVTGGVSKTTMTWNGFDYRYYWYVPSSEVGGLFWRTLDSSYADNKDSILSGAIYEAMLEIAPEVGGPLIALNMINQALVAYKVDEWSVQVDEGNGVIIILYVNTYLQFTRVDNIIPQQ